MKGGAQRTYAVDQDAAKYILRAALSRPSVTKFLMISHLSSRRKRAPWWTDSDWQAAESFMQINPDYYKAKLEADEYFISLAMKRRQAGDKGFQGIILRPSFLSDEPSTGKVDLGHSRATGMVSREDVAIVADRLLARDDSRGMKDIVGGDVPIDEAVDSVTRPHVCAIDGEDINAILARFSDETLQWK